MNAGDVILADESGVLVLPADEAEKRAIEAIARQERINEIQARVKSGEKLGDLLGASKLVLEAMRAND